MELKMIIVRMRLLLNVLIVFSTMTIYAQTQELDYRYYGYPLGEIRQSSSTKWGFSLEAGLSGPWMGDEKSLDIVLTFTDSENTFDNSSHESINRSNSIGLVFGGQVDRVIFPGFRIGTALTFRTAQSFQTVFYSGDAVNFMPSNSSIYASGGYDLKYDINSLSPYFTLSYQFGGKDRTKPRKAAFGVELGAGVTWNDLRNSVPNVSFQFVDSRNPELNTSVFSNNSSMAAETSQSTSFSWYASPFVHLVLNKKRNFSLDLGCRLADMGDIVLYERKTDKESLISIFSFQENEVTSTFGLSTTNRQKRLRALDVFLRFTYSI